MMGFFKGEIYFFFSAIFWYHCHFTEIRHVVSYNQTQTQILFLLKKASWKNH